MKSLIILFYFIPLICSCQNSLSPDNFPGRGNGAFVFDPVSGCLIFAGAVSPKATNTKNDVWKWNGTTWSKIHLPGPGLRDFFPGAFNPETGTACFYGGFDHPDGVIWSFDGNNWTKMPIEGLVDKDHHQMVYADHLKAFVIYGGNIEREKLDTLTWIIKDGKALGQNIPGPGIRYHSGMAYDKNRKKIVMYGGGEKPSELWEFDGMHWEKIMRDVNPGRKLYHHMVYDESLKKVILHGGWHNQDPNDPFNALTPETWTWDGNTWTKITKQDVFAVAMGYDASRKVVVAYGRSASRRDAPYGIWNLQNGRWEKIASYGSVDPGN